MWGGLAGTLLGGQMRADSRFWKALTFLEGALSRTGVRPPPAHTQTLLSCSVPGALWLPWVGMRDSWTRACPGLWRGGVCPTNRGHHT